MSARNRLILEFSVVFGFVIGAVFLAIKVTKSHAEFVEKNKAKHKAQMEICYPRCAPHAVDYYSNDRCFCDITRTVK